MDRRSFLRRTSLALAGGLIVGDAAMSWWERLTHRKVFALGPMPRLIDIHLTTNYSAGMFSVFVKPAEKHTGLRSVVIDNGVAQATAVGGGWYRVSRYLGDGKIVAKTPTIFGPGVMNIKAVQLEEGRFPSSFIATGSTPATRAADRLSFPLFQGGVKRGRVAGQHTFSRPTPATVLHPNGDMETVPPNVPRTQVFASIGPTLLLEGRRTNYALNQRWFNG